MMSYIEEVRIITKSISDDKRKKEFLICYNKHFQRKTLNGKKLLDNQNKIYSEK